MQSGEQTCFLQPSPQQTLPVAHLPPEQGAAAHRPVLALQAVNEGQKPPDCLRQSGLQCLAVTSQMKSGRSQAIVSPHTGKAAVLAPELLNTGTYNRGGAFEIVRVPGVQLTCVHMPPTPTAAHVKLPAQKSPPTQVPPA